MGSGMEGIFNVSLRAYNSWHFTCLFSKNLITIIKKSLPIHFSTPLEILQEAQDDRSDVSGRPQEGLQ